MVTKIKKGPNKINKIAHLTVILITKKMVPVYDRDNGSAPQNQACTFPKCNLSRCCPTIFFPYKTPQTLPNSNFIPSVWPFSRAGTGVFPLVSPAA